MGGPIDMEWQRCELTECWTHGVTFDFDITRDLDLEFSISNISIAVNQEWEGRSTYSLVLSIFKLQTQTDTSWAIISIMVFYW